MMTTLIVVSIVGTLPVGLPIAPSALCSDNLSRATALIPTDASLTQPPAASFTRLAQPLQSMVGTQLAKCTQIIQRPPRILQLLRKNSMVSSPSHSTAD